MKHGIFALACFVIMLLAMYGALTVNPWQLVLVGFFAILTLYEIYLYIKSNESDETNRTNE